MHDKSPVGFHGEVIDLRKQESKLKKLLSIPRRKLDQEELVEGLRDVRGEIARLESEHGSSRLRCFRRLRIELDGRQSLCDLLENRERVSFWNYRNCTEPAKVLGIFLAKDSPQNQNRRAGSSRAEIIENRCGIEFRRMVPNKYQVERRGLDQLAGFHFVPRDSGINVCLFECVLQRDKGIWVCVEKKCSAPLFHGVAPDRQPPRNFAPDSPPKSFNKSLLKVCDRHHGSA
jgi:hypothetical protein